MDFVAPQDQDIIFLEGMGRRASSTTPLDQGLVLATVGGRVVVAVLLLWPFFLLSLFHLLGKGFLFAQVVCVIVAIITVVVVVVVGIIVIVVKIRSLQPNGTRGTFHSQNAIHFGHALGFVDFYFSLIVEHFVFNYGSAVGVGRRPSTSRRKGRRHILRFCGCLVACE